MPRWLWRLIPHRHIVADEAVLWGTTTVPVDPYCTRCLRPTTADFGRTGDTDGE
jgi:hypothetical protein